MLKFDFLRWIGPVMAMMLTLGTEASKAQTDLAAGDLLFTAYDAQPGISTTGPRLDRISFVALKRMTAGTVLYFTDRGYKGSWFAANNNTEGSMMLTTTAAIEAGKEVLLVLTPGYYNATVDGVSVGIPAAVSPRLSLGNTGDQFFIFQKGGGDPGGAGAVMIAGLHWNVVQSGTFSLITSSAAWDDLNMSGHPSPTLTTTNSNIPPGLVAGQSAFFIGAYLNGNSNINYETASFNGAGKPYADAAAIRSAVLNVANWVRIPSGNGAELSVPTGHFTTTLPVVLRNFSAELKTNGKLTVNWSTASEVNNSHFVLKGSSDGMIWKELGRKAAAANGATGAVYSMELHVGTFLTAGFGLLGLLLLPATRRRWKGLVLLGVVLVVAVSCAKNKGDGLGDVDVSGRLGSGHSLYLRLSQVDRDGTVNESEPIVVRAR